MNWIKNFPLISKLGLLFEIGIDTASTRNQPRYLTFHHKIYQEYSGAYFISNEATTVLDKLKVKFNIGFTGLSKRHPKKISLASTWDSLNIMLYHFHTNGLVWFQETLDELFPSMYEIKRLEEVVLFTVGLMADSTPLVDHVYQTYIKRIQRAGKLGYADTDDEERLESLGKDIYDT